MDIQIGDRVLIKAKKGDADYLSTDEEQYKLVTSMSVLGKLITHNEVGRIKILKVERPVYYMSEENKDEYKDRYIPISYLTNKRNYYYKQAELADEVNDWKKSKAFMSKAKTIDEILSGF